MWFCHRCGRTERTGGLGRLVDSVGGVSVDSIVGRGRRGRGIGSVARRCASEPAPYFADRTDAATTGRRCVSAHRVVVVA